MFYTYFRKLWHGLLALTVLIAILSLAFVLHQDKQYLPSSAPLDLVQFLGT